MSGSSRPLPADFAGRNRLPGQRLRALLADDLAYAGGWSELQQRLKRKGYELRESGGGLALFSFPGGGKLAKASDLGYSYARLMRRFGAPFPGHSHGYLAARRL